MTDWEIALRHVDPGIGALLGFVIMAIGFFGMIYTAFKDDE